MIQKGRKLVTRAIPVLPPQQKSLLFHAIVRNLFLIVTSPRVDKDEESAGKLMQAILGIPAFGIEVSIVFYLQTIIAVHSEQALLKTLTTKVFFFFFLIFFSMDFC